jgi:hypothetical protein
MNDGGLPGWVGDTADVLSIVSVFVTFWLGYQAKNIKDYFFNRVRIGEILPELNDEATELLRALRGWESDNGRNTRLVISRIKGILFNLRRKLGSEERKSVSYLLAKIENRRFYFFGNRVHDVDLESGWEIATDYAAIISQITGVHNDAGWRQ